VAPGFVAAVGRSGESFAQENPDIGYIKAVWEGDVRNGCYGEGGREGKEKGEGNGKGNGRGKGKRKDKGKGNGR
jgi:hypothetical protein